MADKKTLELQIKIAAKEAAKIVSNLSSDFKRLAQDAKQFSSDSGVSKTFAQLQAQATRTAQSFKLFGATSSDLIQMQRQLKTGVLDLVNKGLDPESKEVQQLVKDYKNLENEAKKLDDANGANVTSFSQLQSAITNTATAAIALKAVSLVGDLTGFALTQADTFQTARNEFGILLQDMEAGAGLFAEIQKFNAWTPFDLATTKQATAILYTAKVPLSEMTEELTRFGDLSQGNSQKFTSFIQAFSKGAAKGKVDMEVLNVFLDQGVPILDALAKQFSTTTSEIIEMSSAGEISFTQFQNALKKLTAEGGQYYGGMTLASQSLAAMQEGLTESVSALAASFGAVLLPAIISVLGSFTAFINSINESPLLKGILAGAITAITALLIALAVKQTALTVATWLGYTAQMALNTALSITNPFLLAGIAAAALATAGFVAYATAQQKAADSTNANTLKTREQQDNIKNLALSYDDLTQSIANYQQKLKQDSNDSIKESIQLLELDIQMSTAAIASWENDLKKMQSERSNKMLMQMPEVNLPVSVGHSLEDGRGLKSLDREIEYLKGRIEETAQTISENNKVLEATRSTLSEKQITNQTPAEKIKALIPPDFTTEWTDQLLTGVDALEREMIKAQKTLGEQSIASFGEQWQTQKEYIEEKAALELHYANEIADYNANEANKERERIINLSQDRMDAFKEEAAYQAALALENGNYGNFAGETAKSEMSDTDLGQVMSGANPIAMFIESLISAVLEIENVAKTFNFIQTIVQSLIEVVEPIIDTIFKPFVEILEQIGTTIGDILAPMLNIIGILLLPIVFILKVIEPILQALSFAFIWFNNKVIAPVGNAIIDAMNGVISALNRIPFVNIDKIARLNYIGDLAVEMAETLTEQQEKIKNMYDRQKDVVNDLLDAQISGLKSQYELGLISRDEFTAQAEQYRSAAEDELIDINKKMEEHLANIEKNGTQKAISPSNSWSGLDTSGIEHGLTGLSVGTPNIPYNMPAMVHKGETIIPKTFAQGIRAGDLALVGGGNKSKGGTTAISITINVSGNVTSEKELSKTLYDNIATLISSGQKSPLPSGAY